MAAAIVILVGMGIPWLAPASDDEASLSDLGTQLEQLHWSLLSERARTPVPKDEAWVFLRFPRVVDCQRWRLRLQVVGATSHLLRFHGGPGRQCRAAMPAISGRMELQVLAEEGAGAIPEEHSITLDWPGGNRQLLLEWRQRWLGGIGFRMRVWEPGERSEPALGWAQQDCASDRSQQALLVLLRRAEVAPGSGLSAGKLEMLADCLLAHGLLLPARTYLDAWAGFDARDPALQRLFSRLAQQLTRRGQHRLSVEILRQSVQPEALGEKWLRAQILSISLIALGELEAAAVALDAQVNADQLIDMKLLGERARLYPYMRYNLAMLAMTQGDVDQATTLLDKLGRGAMEPAQASERGETLALATAANQRLGAMLLERGDAAGALQVFRRPTAQPWTWQARIAAAQAALSLRGDAALPADLVQLFTQTDRVGHALLEQLADSLVERQRESAAIVLYEMLIGANEVRVQGLLGLPPDALNALFEGALSVQQRKHGENVSLGRWLAVQPNMSEMAEGLLDRHGFLVLELIQRCEDVLRLQAPEGIAVRIDSLKQRLRSFALTRLTQVRAQVLADAQQAQVRLRLKLARAFEAASVLHP